MSRSNVNHPRRAWAALAAALLVAASLAAGPVAVRAAAPAGEDPTPCGLSGGTLTTVLTPDTNSDFVVFGLYDDKGEEVAKQFIPLYNPNASAELMITPIGFDGAVASAKCLADPSLRRCGDASWQIDEGLAIALSGIVVGPDFAIATVGGRYKRPSSTAQLAIDGGIAGFQIDKLPVQWSAFYNSEQEVSQAFFALPGGDHVLTIGTRDPQTAALLPQDRLCFRT